MSKRYSMDLTQGSVFKKLILFAIPILLTNLLQQLYHSADVVVVGNFARDSKIALAAVGSCGSVTNLLLDLFLGLSIGANVLCANLYGAGNRGDLKRAMETSLITATVSGVFIGAVGFFFAKTFLTWMGTPASVLGAATTYMKIVFLGQPGSLIYNFGASILRAHGDTKRPMYILTFSGLVNVALNLLFVIVFHLDAAGVALATTISHYVSAAAILFLLCHPAGEQRLDLMHLSFEKKAFFEILRIGIPGGLNGVVFSISNVIIMSAVNSMGDTVIAGNAAGAGVDAFLFKILSSFYNACVTFAGQNFGAKKLKRIDRLLWQSILVADGIYLCVFTVLMLFPEFFLGLFTRDMDVIQVGIDRLKTIGAGYFLYCVSEMAIGCTRGMGKTLVPTVLNAAAICIPRILWVIFAFPQSPSLYFLYLCYPISYVFCTAAQLWCYFDTMKKEKKSLASSAEAAIGDV